MTTLEDNLTEQAPYEPATETSTTTELEPEVELNPEEVASLLAAMAKKPLLIKGALAQRAAHEVEHVAIRKADADLLKSLGYKTTRAPRKVKAPPVPGQPVPEPKGKVAGKKK